METLRFPDDVVDLPQGGSNLPLVSIVVPTYNTPEFQLERCLASLYGQTYGSIEIVVVDDGSDPEYLEAAVKLVSCDPRARLIPAGHGGVSHARNVGMAEARGEWLAFADADDEVAPAFVEEALRVALETGTDLVCGSVSVLYRGEGAGVSESACPVTVAFGDEETRSLALQMLGPVKYKYFTGPDFQGRGPVAKLYRAVRVRGLKYDESIAIGEDTLFNYRYIERCNNVAIIETTWYWYFQHEGSAVHSPELSKWTSSIDGILAACDEGEDPTPFLSRCAFMATQGVTNFLQSGDGKEARHNALALLKYAHEKGCFSSPSFKGYSLSPWLNVMVRLCSCGWFSAALAFWWMKIKASDVLRHRSLLAQ